MINRLLIVALALAYVATAVQTGQVWDQPADDLLRLGGAYGPAVASGELWRLASAIFLHGGLLHLAFNALALFDLGRTVERRVGPTATLLIFLLTGMAGFAASVVWHEEHVSIGASGGIFGLLGVWAVLAWRRSAPVDARQALQRGLVLLVLVSIAIGAGFLMPGVDHAAHVGGLGAGLLLSLGALAPTPPRPNRLFAPIRLTLAGALCMVLSFTLISRLPSELAVSYRESVAFHETYADFAQADRLINQQLMHLGEESRQGRLTDAQALSLLENVLLPALQIEVNRWTDRRFTSPRQENQRAQWEHYARLRRDAVESIRDAARGADPNGLQRFESKMREANALAKAAGGTVSNDSKPPPR